MQRKAVAASIAIHCLLLAPGLITLSPGLPTAPPQHVVNLVITAPPSHKTTVDQETTISRGNPRPSESNSAEIPSIPNSLIIQIDRTGFESIFVAADHWHATLHAGVPYSDPGAGLQVFFCRPEDYGALKGRYQPGDAVWFSFPLVFKSRAITRVQEYIAARRIVSSPTGVLISFTNTDPDYFGVRDLFAGAPRTGACS